MIEYALHPGCTQLVNPEYTYICKVDKKFLPRR